MTLYSYIVKHDSGFAPNPFFGYCTLACCKPGIRRKAKKGDWIVGLTPKADGNKIVYFMEVNEKMSFDKYWRNKRFSKKKPELDCGIKRKNGDNIYEPQGTGGYRQLPSAHSKPKFGNREDPKMKRRDLGGQGVLVSKHFAYFGSEPKTLPKGLKRLIVGIGYRCHFKEDIKKRFVRFAEKEGFGGYLHCPHWRNKERIAETFCRS
jgi:hypothetical protein